MKETLHLAPSHRGFADETGIGDLHLRPAGADLRHDALARRARLSGRVTGAAASLLRRTSALPSTYAASSMLRLLYWLYEAQLRRKIRTRPPPRHVGIIPDGNRRYARKHGLVDPRAAYDLGAEKLDEVLSWCSELKIPAVTLWVCSSSLSGLFTYS